MARIEEDDSRKSKEGDHWEVTEDKEITGKRKWYLRR